VRFCLLSDAIFVSISLAELRIGQFYRWRKAMTKLTFLSAAAVLSMMAATPAFAMQALQEPGAFAQYRPHADILNTGVHSRTHSMGALAFLPPGKSHAKRHLTRR
jgi:hypothetical protein